MICRCLFLFAGASGEKEPSGKGVQDSGAASADGDAAGQPPDEVQPGAAEGASRV